MHKFSRGTRFVAVMLASSFCLLAVTQLTRPIADLGVYNIPGAGNLHQKLTRHNVEEVGEEELEFSDPPERRASIQDEPRRNLFPASAAREIDARPLHRLIHRKVLPPSPDDDN